VAVNDLPAKLGLEKRRFIAVHT